MSKMVQIRNMPDALHRKFKVRAAMMGMSLSDYLLLELRQVAEVPTLAEFRQLLQKLEPVTVPLDTVRILHEGRDER